MKLVYTDHFRKRLKKRLEKNSKLREKVGKQLKLLGRDLTYPSLRTHKLKGERILEYAIWIEGDLRITFQIIGEGILLTDIITHDEY